MLLLLAGGMLERSSGEVEAPDETTAIDGGPNGGAMALLYREGEKKRFERPREENGRTPREATEHAGERDGPLEVAPARRRCGNCCCLRGRRSSGLGRARLWTWWLGRRRRRLQRWGGAEN